VIKKPTVQPPKSLPALIEDALSIERESAKDAGAIGFIARALAIATMPHRKVQGGEFSRSNGLFTLTMYAPLSVGLPYGSYPRLLLSWLTTEAVRTKSREIELGDSLSGFMGELGLKPTGGRWGTIPNLKRQMASLFCCAISCLYRDKQRAAEMGYRMVSGSNLWWDPKSPEQRALWRSSVSLSKEFFDEVVDRPVPIDLRILGHLRRSPLALDIYSWLTYRTSYLRGPVSIPWGGLKEQFGSQYADTKKGTHHFREEFERQLKAVLKVYTGVEVETTPEFFTLKSGRPSVEPRINLKL